MVEKHMYKCKFCNKEFKRESTLSVHMCVKKQRWAQRDERYVQIAFNCWLKFMNSMMTRKKTGYTFEDFINSSLYMGFIKYARHIMLLNVHDVDNYTDFLMQSGYKLQDWTKNYVYETYMKSLTSKESPERGITRSMVIMEKWAEDNNTELTLFFKEVTPTEAVYMITSGKISPWMIFCSSTSKDLIEKFNPEQMIMVNEFIDISRWKLRIKKFKEEFDHISNVLMEAGL